MSKVVLDQADGLRRLMARTSTRMVAVVGMQRGTGVTTAAMNLGAALALQGRDVLFLDEQCPQPQSASSVWALDPPGTLDDVAVRRLSFEAASARAHCGVYVLAAPPSTLTAEVEPFALWQGGVILVDARLDATGRLSALAQRADDVVVVLHTYPSSITSAYSGIKNLHYAHSLKQFRLLVNAVASDDQARQVMGNLVHTGSRYLSVSLQPAGWVRLDPSLPDAGRLSQTIVEAFPASPAAVDYRRIASDMSHWPAHPAARRSPVEPEGERAATRAVARNSGMSPAVAVS